MKKNYIKKFELFKEDRVNEEFLSGLVNFFKNMWNKATEQLKKLGKNPTMKQLDEWVENNILNSSSDTYLFKTILEEFKKKTEANNEDCMKLVDDILDPQTGALGIQGLQPLYDSLLKVFGNSNKELEILKYYFESSRNKAIKNYKFGGGPDLKVGEEGIIKSELKKMDLTDTTHLPELKKILQGLGDDNKKKKDSTINWVENILLKNISNYVKEISEDQVNEYLKTKGIEASKSETGDYKVGDKVIYKRDEFVDEDWDKLSDDEKKNTEDGKMKDLQLKQIGIKEIKKISGDDIEFEDNDGKPFTKSINDILMKVDVEKVDGQDDLVNTLKDLKSKNPEAVTKLDSIAKLYSDPETNKEKIENIEKNIN